MLHVVVIGFARRRQALTFGFTDPSQIKRVAENGDSNRPFELEEEPLVNWLQKLTLGCVVLQVPVALAWFGLA